MVTIAIGYGQTQCGYVVRITGRGTMREGRTMVECINRADLAGAGRITVDLTATDYLDSTCLGSLVALHQRFNAGGADRFQVAASAAQLSRLFGGTRLDRLLKRFPDAIHVAAWQEIPTAVMDGPTLADFVIDCHRRLAELGGNDSASFLLVAELLARQERAAGRTPTSGGTDAASTTGAPA
jgi:anti-sigma B factor antagonist